MPTLLLMLITVVVAAPPRGQDPDLAFEQIVLGEAHGCGLSATGAVACWGRNDRGQLGHADVARSYFPLPVAGVLDAVYLAAGDHHTCAIRKDRSVACWGDNQSGQLGNGNQDAHVEAVSVLGLNGALSIAAGAAHTCASTPDQRVVCWGNNLYGQLGTTSLRMSSFPLPVPDVSGAVDVAAGYGHSCAVGPELPVTCWGDPTHGELGRAIPEEGDPMAPGPIDPGIAAVRAVDARGTQTCALADDGIWCWGQDPLDDVPQPVAQIVDMRGLVDLSLGWSHGCAVTKRRDVVCFGDDRFGQLGVLHAKEGLGVGAFGLVDAAGVAAGNGESCAPRGAGKRSVCWGSYTDEETAAAKLEAPDLDPVKRKKRLALPPNTDLALSMGEILGNDGARVRITVETATEQPCANTRIDNVVETKGKGKRFIMKLGDMYLPGGDCIAESGPATAWVDFPLDTVGNRYVLVRYKGREDFYEIRVRMNRLEAIPLSETFSIWDGEKALQRVPPGSLAISCIDMAHEPLCQRRMRDGLPVCGDLVHSERVKEAPSLNDKKDYANAWFTSDPDATLISPDANHEAWKNWFQDTWRDGSQCMDVRVKTWRGEVWTNQHPLSKP